MKTLNAPSLNPHDFGLPRSTSEIRRDDARDGGGPCGPPGGPACRSGSVVAGQDRGRVALRRYAANRRSLEEVVADAR
jgi:hypothetical protein